MTSLALHCFGIPRIYIDDAPIEIRRRKAIALLTYLAVTQRTHSRDALAALFWPDNDQTSARGNLRRTLSVLNRSLGGDWLVVDREQAALRRQDGLWVDVVDFHAHLSQCATHGHGKGQICPDCLTPLQASVALYSDDFLAGFSLVDASEFGVWQVHQAETLRRELADALERLALCYAASGDYAEAIVHARRLLELDTLHESAQRMLMRLYTQSGNRSAAIHKYEECVRVVHEELGIQPELETTALYEKIRSGEVMAEDAATAAVADVTSEPIYSLPEQLTVFIGRTQEMERIQRRLADPYCRLMTIVGPGGIGKTRLAIQFAEMNAGHYRDGVCFVDLTSLNSADLLAATILHAVSPDEYGDTNARRRLYARLRDRQLLLVLDNFEHLLEGADLLPDLLRSAPDLTILVSSRKRLNLHEEWLESLGGLAYPANGETTLDPAQILAHDATRLFLDRVRHVRSGWQPTLDDAALIAVICRKLEGMPLGIELAAAWTRTLPLADVSSELERGLSILSTSHRDVPPRHRSMSAVFDQSWGMLQANERSVMRQMSVFRGGCTREAAEEVTGAGLSELTTLVDSSWLRLRSSGRYDMHELVRQYCAEMLEAEHEAKTGEDESRVRHRHCDYYAELLSEPVLKTNFRGEVIQLFITEMGNIHSGLQWAAALPYLPAIHPLIMGMWFTSEMLGWHDAAYETMSAAAQALQAHLDRLDCDNYRPGHHDASDRDEMIANLAELYMAQASFSMQFGSLRRTREDIKKSVDMAEKANSDDERYLAIQADPDRRRIGYHFRKGDYESMLQAGMESLARFEDKNYVCIWYGKEKGQAFNQAGALAGIGVAYWYMGQYEDAEQWLCRDIALAEESGNQRHKGLVCSRMAQLLVTTGRYPQAAKFAAEAMAANQNVGNVVFNAQVQYVLGMAQRRQGNLTSARNLLVQGVRMWQQTHHHMITNSIVELARVELADGDTAAARTMLLNLIHELEQSGSAESRYITSAHLGLGWIALTENDLTEARDMFRMALASGKCAAWEKMEGIAGLAEVAVQEDHVEDAAELLALVVAHPFTAYAQREKSRHSLEALKEENAPDIFAERIKVGKGRDLDVTLTELQDRPLISRGAGAN